MYENCTTATTKMISLVNKNAEKDNFNQLTPVITTAKNKKMKNNQQKVT